MLVAIRALLLPKYAHKQAKVVLVMVLVSKHHYWDTIFGQRNDPKQPSSRGKSGKRAHCPVELPATTCASTSTTDDRLFWVTVRRKGRKCARAIATA